MHMCVIGHHVTYNKRSCVLYFLKFSDHYVTESQQGRRHRVTVFCGDTVRWFTAKSILRWTFPMNMMSNHTCSDRPFPTCKTSIVVTATIFTLFKANIQRWRPAAATTKEGQGPSAAPPLLWFPLYWLWIGWISQQSPQYLSCMSVWLDIMLVAIRDSWFLTVRAP